MNYRHSFHAGNFADVLKHVVLSRMLVHLAEKPAPFRVIDTHAGAGVYSLIDGDAERTGEWRRGIGRLHGVTLDPRSTALLRPYLDAVVAESDGLGNGRTDGQGDGERDGRESLSADGAIEPSPSRPAGSALRAYPGSPALALRLMRAQDRLLACELEPGAAAALARRLARDPRGKAVAIDGWTALGAFVPPKERRGLILIDPPFEQPDEFARLVAATETAQRKWPGGTLLIWYPVKDARAVATFVRQVTALRLGKALRIELDVGTASTEGGLHATGLIAVNPPWTLRADLAHLLPVLAEHLRGAAPARIRLDSLGQENLEPISLFSA